MAEDEKKTGGFASKLKEEMKKIPWWGYVIGIGGGAFLIMKMRSSASTGVQATGATNANGTSDTSSVDGYPYDSQWYNDTGQSGYPGGPSPSPSPSPNPSSGTVRQKNSDPPYTNSWDSSHSGVPYDTSPGSGQAGIIPYGGSVQITGASVQGPANFNGPGSSTTWFPISINGQTGYISQFDLASMGQGGASGEYDDWHNLHAPFHTDISAIAHLVDLGMFI